MKFTWGTGILIFLILFVLSIGSFVIFAFSHDVNLVHKEYYQKGVDYDEERIKKNNGASQMLQFDIKQIDEYIEISVNEDYFSLITDVEAHFYRPSDRHQDLHLNFESNRLKVRKSDLASGRYTLYLKWKQADQDFLIEKYIFLK